MNLCPGHSAPLGPVWGILRPSFQRLYADLPQSRAVPHHGGNPARSLAIPTPLAYHGIVRFIETSPFTEDVEHELSLDEYRQLQLALLFRPGQGALIRGSGGLRKMRWGRPGMGKRGGLRVIYFWEARSETFYMLTMYRKKDQDDLTHRQTAILRRLVEEEFK